LRLWNQHPEFVPFLDIFERGTEQFTLRVSGRAAGRPFWMYWPPGEEGDPGIHYDIYLEDKLS
jgi:hypothetical protein